MGRHSPSEDEQPQEHMVPVGPATTPMVKVRPGSSLVPPTQPQPIAHARRGQHRWPTPYPRPPRGIYDESREGHGNDDG